MSPITLDPNSRQCCFPKLSKQPTISGAAVTQPSNDPTVFSHIRWEPLETETEFTSASIMFIAEIIKVMNINKAINPLIHRSFM